MNIIEVRNVSKFFTGHTALDDVTIDVKEGSVHGLLGPNGAGKTTLIRIINHITAPDKGTVSFDGHPLVESDIKHMGYLPEERGLYKKMKVGEQAMFFARLKGLTKHDAEREIKQWFEKFQIMEWWNKKVEELSKGMAQKIQFIITVLHKPRLLIFDEPFSGFDPINAALLRDEMLELNRRGTTIIFSTHNMASAEEVCDHITLINQSHNILEGSVKELKHQYGHGRMNFTVSTAGYDSSLLEPLCTLVETTAAGDITHLLATPREGVTRRDIINTLNDRADLIAVSPAEPSLEEIFITTVQRYNQAHSHE